MLIPLVMALLFAVIGLALFAASRASLVTTRDVAWLSGTTDSAPDEASVYRRWLTRHRRHRAAGGLFGVTFACVAGLSWNNTVSIGVGNGPPWADVLWCGLAGVVLGSLSAESFRLSEPRSTVQFASLTTRPELARLDLVRWARLLCIGALALGLVAAATGTGPASLGVAIGGSLVLGGTEVVRRSIRSRRRPVLSDRATTVDVRLREFASRSTAHLAMAAGLLTLAWTVSKAPDLLGLAALSLVVVLGLFVAAIVHLVRAAPHPPRRWRPAAA